MNQLNNQSSAVSFIGRVLIAAIFLISAAGKIAAPAMTVGYIEAMGMPFPTLSLIGAIALELTGGALLVLGWQTRLTALLLAGFSVATGIVFHGAIGDQNQMIHLLKNFAMAGGLLQLAAFGAGAFSVDVRSLSTRQITGNKG